MIEWEINDKWQNLNKVTIENLCKAINSQCFETYNCQLDQVGLILYIYAPRHENNYSPALK